VLVIPEAANKIGSTLRDSCHTGITLLPTSTPV